MFRIIFSEKNSWVTLEMRREILEFPFQSCLPYPVRLLIPFLFVPLLFLLLFSFFLTFISFPYLIFILNIHSLIKKCYELQPTFQRFYTLSKFQSQKLDFQY